MSLLSSIFDTLLPKKYKPGPGARPFIDLGKGGNDTFNAVGFAASANLNSLASIPTATMDKLNEDLKYSAQYSITLGKNPNIGGIGYTAGFGPGLIQDIILDPNKAAESTIFFARQIRHKPHMGRMAFNEFARNFLIENPKFNIKAELRDSLYVGGGVLDTMYMGKTLREQALEVFNSDAAYVGGSTWELGVDAITRDTKNKLRGTGTFTAPQLADVDTYLTQLRDRKKIQELRGLGKGARAQILSELRGTSGFGGTLSNQQQKALLGEDPQNKGIVGGYLGSIYDADSEGIKEAAIIEIAHKLDSDPASTVREKDLAKKLSDNIGKGRTATDFLELTNSVATNLGIDFNSIVQGKFLQAGVAAFFWGDLAGLMSDPWAKSLEKSLEKYSKFLPKKLQGEVMQSYKNATALATINPIYLFRSITWDGSAYKTWAYILKGTKFEGPLTKLYEYAPKQLYENFMKGIYTRVPRLNAELILRQAGMHELADAVQNMGARGIPRWMGALVRTPFKRFYSWFNGQIAKLMLKIGAKGALRAALTGILQTLGSVVPLIGNAVAWVVEKVAEEIVWGTLVVIIKAIFLFAAVIIVTILMFSTSMQQMSALMPVTLLPGEQGSDYAPGGNTSILDELSGASAGAISGSGIVGAGSGALTQLNLTYSTQSPLDNPRCTQGYYGGFSHSVLWKPLDQGGQNTYAIDVSGSNPIRSPVNGVIKGKGTNGTSLEYIVIEIHDTRMDAVNGQPGQIQDTVVGEMMIMHVNLSTCNVDVGQKVGVGQEICGNMYDNPIWISSNKTKCVKCPSSGGGYGDINQGGCCWAGAHLHIYARTPTGDPIDVARILGVCN